MRRVDAHEPREPADARAGDGEQGPGVEPPVEQSSRIESFVRHGTTLTCALALSASCELSPG